MIRTIKNLASNLQVINRLRENVKPRLPSPNKVSAASQASKIILAAFADSEVQKGAWFPPKIPAIKPSAHTLPQATLDPKC